MLFRWTRLWFNNSYVIKQTALSGNLKLFKYIENKGVDLLTIDGVASVGDLCLKFSATSGTTDIIDYLLDIGIDINTLNSTAIVQAVSINDIDMIKYLVNNGSNITHDAMKYSLIKNNLEIIQYFTSVGADYSDSSNLLLRYFSEFGNDIDDKDLKKEIIEYLSTTPNIIIESIINNQEFHTVDNIKSAIKTIKSELETYKMNEKEQYDANVKIKILSSELIDNNKTKNIGVE